MTDPKPWTTTLHGPDATHHFGVTLGRACRGGERIALNGELGAGKTSLARGLAAGLGIAPTKISSPTFTIIHEHSGRGGLRFVHVDAYRLGEPEELEALGWDELSGDDRTVIAMEWPERAGRMFDAPTVTVTLEHALDETSTEAGARHVCCLFHSGGAHLYDAVVSRCPTCGDVITDQEHASHPFCSKRCRMADLENWFSGRYVVSREIEEDDLVDPDLG